MDEALRTEGLSIGYDGHALLRELSFQLPRGQVVTLLGPNGSGKSTLLKSLTRQLKPLGGAVYLGAEDALAMNSLRFARQVAVVLTEKPNPELMTCWDVVASGRSPYTGRMGLLSARDMDEVLHAMETLRVLDLAQRQFHAVSDGQRQRVLLARALCQQPRVLVLDEPTSYLDLRHKLELLTILRDLARREHLTVLMSLHEIDLAQKVSDRLLCVKEGELVCVEDVERVFDRAFLRDLYDLEDGCYDPRFGSIELPGVPGEPEVFVVSACGTGIPVFRQLQRLGVPFAAGVLYENDVDCAVAESLATEVVREQPFCPISREKLDRALFLLSRCPRAVCTEFPLREGNRGLLPLVEAARRKSV